MHVFSQKEELWWVVALRARAEAPDLVGPYNHRREIPLAIECLGASSGRRKKSQYVEWTLP